MNEKNRVCKILVIQTAFLGDLLLTVPMLKRLRKTLSQQGHNPHISVLCRQGLGEVLTPLRIVDQVFEVEKKKVADKLKIFEQLCQNHFEIILCPHRSLTSRWLVSRIPHEKAFGFFSWPFSKKISDNRSWPESLRILSLLSDIDPELGKGISDISASKVNVLSSNWKIPEWAQPSFANLQSNNPRKKKVALFPGSNWEGKMWPVEKFGELARRLHLLGVEVIIFGDQRDIPLSERIQLMAPKSESRVGKNSIVETFQQIQNEVRVVVANDSAGQHFGALAECEVVSLFGPTRIEMGFRPWTNSWNHFALDLECRPCNPHGPRVCPLGHHRCMIDLDVDPVFECIRKIFANVKSQESQLGSAL